MDALSLTEVGALEPLHILADLIKSRPTRSTVVLELWSFSFFPLLLVRHIIYDIPLPLTFLFLSSPNVRANTGVSRFFR